MEENCIKGEIRMKIYNEDRTKELLLDECNLNLGYFVTESETIQHEAIEKIEEEGHYEVVKVYEETGGQDVEWIIDVPGQEAQEAWEEIIVYQRYILYTEMELEIQKLNAQIQDYKNRLIESDFQAIKYAEGLYTEEQYEPTRKMRQSYRDKINELNEKIKSLTPDEDQA